MNKNCKCNNPDPLLCHECEESTGVCYCKCHAPAIKRTANEVKRLRQFINERVEAPW